MDILSNTLNHIKEINKNETPDIDLAMLNSITGLNLTPSDYDSVVEENTNLTQEYQPIIMLYGFESFLDIFVYSMSSNSGEIQKSLNRFNLSTEVFLPNQEQVMKGIVKEPISASKGDIKSKENPSLEKDSEAMSFNLLGKHFGKVNPQDTKFIDQIPEMFITKGTLSKSCDDYLFYNINNITNIIVGIKVSKNIELSFISYNSQLNKQLVYRNVIYSLAKLGFEYKKDVKINKKIVENSSALDIMSDNSSLIKYTDLEVEEK